LLNLIDHLPSDSYYAEAVALDPEAAEAYLASGHKGSSAPPLSEYGPIVMRLDRLFDRTGELIQAIAQLGGAKGGKVTPAPRPRLAIEEVKMRRQRAQHERITKKLIPDST
jgi:hypothetical protein